MRALSTQFMRHGFTFTQKANLHPVYVYEQSRGCLRWFEVIKARPKGEGVINGRVIEARWSYPTSELWGSDGFTCQTLERAMEKAKELAA